MLPEEVTESHGVVVAISALRLVVPIAEVKVEFRVQEWLSLAVLGAVGSDESEVYESISVLGLGGQVLAWCAGPHGRGFAGGVQALYEYRSANSLDQRPVFSAFGAPPPGPAPDISGHNLGVLGLFQGRLLGGPGLTLDMFLGYGWLHQRLQAELPPATPLNMVRNSFYGVYGIWFGWTF